MNGVHLSWRHQGLSLEQRGLGEATCTSLLRFTHALSPVLGATPPAHAEEQ